MTHAIRIHQTGGPEVLSWEAVVVPAPAAGEATVRHHAVGLNFIDTYHRTGLYPLPLPSGIGLEGAGVVEAVGEGVTEVKVGDRVAYAGGPSVPMPKSGIFRRIACSNCPPASVSIPRQR